MELAIERIDLESSVRKDRAMLDERRPQILATATYLGISRHFTAAERDAFDTPVGKLRDCEVQLARLYADVPYLLWALGRIPRLYSVDELGDELDNVLAGGLLHAGPRAITDATLLPYGQIDNELSDVAHANALLIGRPDTATTVPPGSVFSIWPWLQYADWKWGEQIALEIELLGTRWKLSAEGMRPLIE